MSGFHVHTLAYHITVYFFLLFRSVLQGAGCSIRPLFTSDAHVLFVYVQGDCFCRGKFTGTCCIRCPMAARLTYQPLYLPPGYVNYHKRDGI